MLTEWAQRWGVSDAALSDLVSTLSYNEPRDDDEHTEAFSQSQTRLEASRLGYKLFRNNVGVFLDSRGVPVRYGLANDSKQLNAVMKSADLIGWRPVLITPAHVGRTIAQFLSRECKRPGWTYSGTPREEAQAKWALLVNKDGGDATFSTGEGSF